MSRGVIRSNSGFDFTKKCKPKDLQDLVSTCRVEMSEGQFASVHEPSLEIR